MVDDEFVTARYIGHRRHKSINSSKKIPLDKTFSRHDLRKLASRVEFLHEEELAAPNVDKTKYASTWMTDLASFLFREKFSEYQTDVRLKVSKDTAVSARKMARDLCNCETIQAIFTRYITQENLNSWNILSASEFEKATLFMSDELQHTQTDGWGWKGREFSMLCCLFLKDVTGYSVNITRRICCPIIERIFRAVVKCWIKVINVVYYSVWYKSLARVPLVVKTYILGMIEMKFLGDIRKYLSFVILNLFKKACSGKSKRRVRETLRDCDEYVDNYSGQFRENHERLHALFGFVGPTEIFGNCFKFYPPRVIRKVKKISVPQTFKATKIIGLIPWARKSGIKKTNLDYVNTYLPIYSNGRKSKGPRSQLTHVSIPVRGSIRHKKKKHGR